MHFQVFYFHIYHFFNIETIKENQSPWAHFSIFNPNALQMHNIFPSASQNPQINATSWAYILPKRITKKDTKYSLFTVK